MPRWLYFLLIFSLLAVILDFLHVPDLVIFIIAALGIVPSAALIGVAVEDVAEHTGEKIGGLLFATFGNATELIIGILALTQGLTTVVSASIIGSVLGNALLVLGISVCIGGFKHGRLHFEAQHANQYAALLALSIGGLLLPTIAELLASLTNLTQMVEQRIHLTDFNTIQQQISARGIFLSDSIAVLLLVGYIGSILFTVFRLGDKGQPEHEELELIVGARSMAAITRLLMYRRHVAESSAPNKSGVLSQIDDTLHAIVTHEQQAHNVPTEQVQVPEAVQGTGAAQISGSTQDTGAAQGTIPTRRKPLWRGLLLLMLTTVGVGILSEILVGTIEPMTNALHWSPAFVGLVFIPLIGDLPEYFNTISMALDKRMDMVLAASAGSSIQIALLIAPILVLVSWFAPYRLGLVFSLVELGVLGLATILFSEITKDGEFVWLEGLLLILLYAMMGGTVFLFGN